MRLVRGSWSAAVLVCLSAIMAAEDARPAIGGLFQVDKFAGLARRINSEPLSGFVVVTTDKEVYRFGEQIRVTVYNGLTDPISSPTKLFGCALVAVDHREMETWVRHGTCAPRGILRTIIVAPGSQIAGMLSSLEQENLTIGPVVGEPTGALVFEGNAENLPTVEPWKPGDPTWVVPRGDAPGADVRLRLSVLNGALVPGEYRIEFTFQVDNASGSVETALSDSFVVNG